MAHYPDHMNPTERRIASRLLSTILADPALSVRVREAEDGQPATGRTRDRAAIERETAATGATVWEVWQDGARLGSVVLIHGNGPDVISDTSAPDGVRLDQIDALCQPAQSLADKLSG